MSFMFKTTNSRYLATVASLKSLYFNQEFISDDPRFLINITCNIIFNFYNNNSSNQLEYIKMWCLLYF